MQQDLSGLYWERIVPALERLFDELAPPHELIRIDKLEIDLGRISQETLLSVSFIDQLLEQLSVAIVQALEKKNTALATRSPLRLGLFELWLHFLENGTLSAHSLVPDSIPQWHRHILDTLALEANAVERLHQLFLKQPLAFERLILQYDQVFLLQIARLFTGHRHDELPILIHRWAERIAHLLHSLVHLLDKPDRAEVSKQLLKIDAETLGRHLQRSIPALQKDSSWPQRFSNWLRQYSTPIQGKTPQQLQRQLETELWSQALRELVLQRKKLGTVELATQLIQSPLLLHWQAMLTKELSASKWEESGISPKVIQEIKKSLGTFKPTITPSPTLPGAKENSTRSEFERPSDPEEKPFTGLPETIFLTQDAALANMRGETKREDLSEFGPGSRNSFLPSGTKETMFFIKNAGIVLVHTFLPRFFQRLEICEGSAFKTSWHQQKALYLLHYLATKTGQVPEFELVLPKFICGLPLNLPLDIAIQLSKDEQTECENLLEALIEHWGALGSTSPDGLREGFLQRDGRLEKRPSGWFLQVETNTIDLLLDRLPWNLSLIKLPWMEEMLRIEWR